MSARVPRRSFASPFVITLAAAPACTPRPATTPDAPTTDAPTTAAPTPDPQPEPEPTPDPTGADPTPSDPPAPVAADPPRQWTLSSKADGCTTQIIVSCAPKPGEPPRSCNPPAPQSYPCPIDGEGVRMELGANTTIQSDGAGHCYVRQPSGPCPKGALCNPPPPREVPCPK